MMPRVGPVSTPGGGRAAVVDALLRVAAERGLEQATVREVASAAGVAIGTVQHYFPTKDALLAGAFAEVVRRVRERVDSAPRGPDVREDLRAALHQLLPLDGRRREEARLQLAFAARATTSPALADLQRQVLSGVQDALSVAFARARPADDEERCRLAAQAALALVDGLALHAISSSGDGGSGSQAQVDALDLFLEALLPRPPRSP